MEKDIIFWVYASKDAENLIGGTCFEECLLNTLMSFEEYSSFREFEILFDAINKSNKHPQDELLDIFRDDLKLNYDFAKQLNRLDVINHECFEFETDKGKAMQKLIFDIKFIVVKKEWFKSGIFFDFEAASVDTEFDAINKINSGYYCY